MKRMLRNIIHVFFKKIASVSESVAEERRLKEIFAISTIDATALINYSTRILNPQKDKNKIIIGAYSWIRGEIMLAKHGGEVVIGKHVFVGEHSKIWSAAKITIGNNVLISHNVNIHDYDSHPTDYLQRREQSEFILSKQTLPDKYYDVAEAPIVIEDDAWICFNAVILKGVVVGRGAIVAASAVVTKDVPPFSVVAGNPARVIKNLKIS